MVQVSLLAALAVAFCLSSNPALGVEKTTREKKIEAIGNPFYVLEQAELKSPDQWVNIWEIRISEHESSRMFSGSRKIFTAKGIHLKAFGFAGFKITDEKIEPGALYLLDQAGNLFVPNEKGLKQIPGKFSLLEQTADSGLLAVTESQDIVSLDVAGNVLPLLSAGKVGIDSSDRITSVRKENQFTSWITTKKGRVFKTNPIQEILLPNELSKFSGLLGDQDSVWTLDQTKKILSRYDLKSNTIHRVDITESYQDIQDGRIFEFMGIRNKSLFARVGTHVYGFTPATFGNRISFKLVAPHFFGKDIRTFGVNYTLHGSLLSLQPKLADFDSVIKRKDLSMRANLTLADLEPPTEKMPPKLIIANRESSKLRIEGPVEKRIDIPYGSPKKYHDYDQFTSKKLTSSKKDEEKLPDTLRNPAIIPDIKLCESFLK